MATLKLILRSSTSESSLVGSLCIRLIHERQTRNLTLPNCRLFPEEWDGDKQSIIYPENNPKRVEYLQTVDQIITEEYSLLLSYLSRFENLGQYTAEKLAQLYRHHKEEKKLCGYAEVLSLELERRGKYRTARAYRTVTKGLMEFNKGRDVHLDFINNSLIRDFEMHLKDRGCLPNTISYYMRNLRAIYNKAVDCGLIVPQKNEKPFAGTYTGVTRTMKRALSLDELRKFNDLDFSILLKKEKRNIRKHAYLKKLEIAHLYFLFCFYARGMCFIDMAYLKKENIRYGVIRYTRKKTGRQIEIRITKVMQDIINRFASQVKNSPYVFPIIKIPNMENGKQDVNIAQIRLQYESALKAQNYHLKSLSQLSEIDKPISTHWARHTWATMGKEENVPLNVISECLGHTSEKTTLIYLGLLDNSLLDEANERISARLTAV